MLILIQESNYLKDYAMLYIRSWKYLINNLLFAKTQQKNIVKKTDFNNRNVVIIMYSVYIIPP